MAKFTKTFLIAHLKYFSLILLLSAPITKGFQIMENTLQKCMTFVAGKNKFLYATCNSLNVAQRFMWNKDQQLVTLDANNACLRTGGPGSNILSAAPCSSRRRSQLWICKENTFKNVFSRGYVAWTTQDNSGFMMLTRNRASIGNLVIAGTHDNLCALRPTSKSIG